MLHIVILNKGFFPDKLNGKDPSKDRVVVIASETDSIPVSAFQNDIFRNMEVKLLPNIKEESSAEEKNVVRIAQAMLIGQITAEEKEYEIYSDDEMLLKALSPFTGKKVAEKKASSRSSKKKASAVAEKKVSKEEVSDKNAEKEKSIEDKTTKKSVPKKTSEKASAKRPMISSNALKAEFKDTASNEKGENKDVKKTSSGKSSAKKSAVKLPTQAQVKKILGAANSGYAKTVMEVIKTSNQITFEMNMRMKLAEAGLGGTVCQELAKALNDEFGKALPTS
ncbi:hypothetical protein [Butyrivibrio sp. JL13D10]|uniref:hypothetical protein n=1 Tax=Butyrivibrio sp. JL13D10 TaxID=3236815 RepID=UPI0038B567D4